MDGGLVELVDAWANDRRARSRRGLSPASERAYRSDLAGLARRIADAHGRAHPDLAPPSDPLRCP
ncbi:MAG: hypothetical protein M3O70_26120 [Actinomycetota bacterium]|nr:hypothetical protein [Actinomycetota bacterium]